MTITLRGKLSTSGGGGGGGGGGGNAGNAATGGRDGSKKSPRSAGNNGGGLRKLPPPEAGGDDGVDPSSIAASASHAPSAATTTAAASGRPVRAWCALFCSVLAAAAVALALRIRSDGFASFTTASGAPWSLLRSYASTRNPEWGAAARWRAAEHADRASFNQWYYSMITDAATNTTFSLAVGGFRGSNLAGAWLRMKTPTTYTSHYPRHALPFANLHSAPGTLNAVLWSNSTPGEAGAQPLFRIEVLDAQRLRYVAAFPADDSAVDVVFTRVYGVFSGGEDCKISNIPFGYASRVEGRFRMRGVEHEFDASPRYRAYVESTWGCEFPKPGELAFLRVTVPGNDGRVSQTTDCSTLPCPGCNISCCGPA
jgi:hypothetical protein